MAKVYMRFPDFRQKALTLSYDDDGRQDKRLISIMKKHGLKGTFNINSGLFSESYGGEEKGHVTPEEALGLYIPNGMEVAVHGVNHLSLANIDIGMATDEIINDRRALEKLFGRIITGMAYANGSRSINDETVDMVAKCGIRYARTTVSSENFDMPENWLLIHPTCHHGNPRLMELAREFAEKSPSNYYWSNLPQMFYLWGHSHEFDTYDNWRVIEEFAEYIGNRGDIWYATNGEIYNYVQAAERLIFSVDGTMIENPSSLDVWFEDYRGIKRVIPAGGAVTLEK